MELYQLRTFVAAAELGSLARACDGLHLSQPAASAHIKALEAEFGVSLFSREVKGVTLTVAGATLLILAQRMLALAGELRTEAQRLRGKLNGRMRFGVFFDPTLLRLGELMRSLIATHPLLDIEVHQLTSRAVIAGVRGGTLDAGMALCARPPDGLGSLPLEPLRYRIVAPAAWRDMVAADQWSAIGKLPWISTPADGSHYDMAMRIFEHHGFKPGKVIEADSEAMITSLVFAGVGLGLMREDLAKDAQDAGKAVVVPKGEATAELTLVYGNAQSADAVTHAIVEVVSHLWQLKAPAEK